MQTAERGTDLLVRVPLSPTALEGDLVVPQDARGVVLFAHGSGSSRHSPRNRAVAETLNRAGLGTLLLDLLTPAEERTDQTSGHLRFDIELLAGRLVRAMDWLAAEREVLAASTAALTRKSAPQKKKSAAPRKKRRAPARAKTANILAAAS